MQLKTDNFRQIVLSDEAKLGNISVSGNLVFEFLNNGSVSIYQTSDNPRAEKLLDAAQESIELTNEELVMALEIIIEKTKEEIRNAGTIRANELLFESPRDGGITG
ncbi:hypothetical protein P7G87_02680 [Enterococcus asini]|uniref:hypothetical protein n=1 Tax=Enterococcus asini TaxID=57732 RepID=UPI00288EEE4B|nr:hypothetical protein [Enterococcus asini]MDT2783598.1 hypothetical protein [Enterococcus asini]